MKKSDVVAACGLALFAGFFGCVWLYSSILYRACESGRAEWRRQCVQTHPDAGRATNWCESRADELFCYRRSKVGQ